MDSFPQVRNTSVCCSDMEAYSYSVLLIQDRPTKLCLTSAFFNILYHRRLFLPKNCQKPHSHIWKAENIYWHISFYWAIIQLILAALQKCIPIPHLPYPCGIWDLVRRHFRSIYPTFPQTPAAKRTMGSKREIFSITDLYYCLSAD